MSIQDLSEKIKILGKNTLNKAQNIDKELTRHVFIAISVVLVGTLSFGLGKMSKTEEARTPIKISGVNLANVITAEENIARKVISTPETVSQNSKTLDPVVASKNSNKYHYLWCNGAKSISDKNKITFTSKIEAEKAGYILAANCKEKK
ncbi:MAG: hypothetical protein HQ402_01865 [Parcubacteria group bacterium]|nr:hypothetical protein [Parcubacteria group bacterium]